MTIRIIPETFDPVVALSAKCLKGLLELEEALDLKQNTAAALRADHYDFAGSPDGQTPATAATAGKLGQLNEARRTVLTTKAARRAAVEAGRKFNGRAVDYLKGFLGRTWNPNWVVLGFTGGSLRMPRDPVALVLKVRAYFVAHPTHEVPVHGLSAGQATAVATAIDQAIYAESEAESLRDDAVQARDESFDRLRTRLVGLRAELYQLMDPDDMRWRSFGFTRPSDRRIPKKVTGLVLRPGGAPGEIIAQWDAATGAESYRVLRQVQAVDPEPVEAGLFTDRTAIISGLPPGQTVIVSVSARNPAGETTATTGTILVAGEALSRRTMSVEPAAIGRRPPFASELPAPPEG